MTHFIVPSYCWCLSHSRSFGNARSYYGLLTQPYCGIFSIYPSGTYIFRPMMPTLYYYYLLMLITTISGISSSWLDVIPNHMRVRVIKWVYSVQAVVSLFDHVWLWSLDRNVVSRRIWYMVFMPWLIWILWYNIVLVVLHTDTLWCAWISFLL